MDTDILCDSIEELARKAFPKYTVVFSANQADPPRAYAINKEALIDEGSYGKVYKAKEIDLQEMKIIPASKLAAKEFKDIRQFKPEEVAFFKKFYKFGDIAYLNDNVYQIMDYLPGDVIYTLSENTTPVLAPKIQIMNFSQRIALIQLICNSVNLMHHNTVSSGCSMIHSDLKGANIRAKIEFNSAGELVICDVYLLDFGIALHVHDNPDMYYANQAVNGTSLYMPIEYTRDIKGLKSDIYALAPVFMIILGASKPFSFKLQHGHPLETFFATGYCFDGIFTGYDMKTYSPDIRPFVTRLLIRMQDNNLSNRPSSDSIMRFFTTLNNYCKSYEVNEDDEDARYIRAAILALIASGLWVVVCERTGDRPYDYSFENLALASHVPFCRDIVAHEGVIDDSTLTGLLHKHHISLPKDQSGANSNKTYQGPSRFFRVKSIEFEPVVTIPVTSLSTN